MQETAITTNLTLEEVKQHFDHWRATRVKRGKIPDTLWHEVKSLIGRYSTNLIAQTLSVNAAQISMAVKSATNFTFVTAHQVNPSSPAKDIVDTQSTCSIEIHRSNGGIMRIAEFPVVSLTAIINQFME